MPNYAAAAIDARGLGRHLSKYLPGHAGNFQRMKFYKRIRADQRQISTPNICTYPTGWRVSFLLPSVCGGSGETLAPRPHHPTTGQRQMRCLWHCWPKQGANVVSVVIAMPPRPE